MRRVLTLLLVLSGASVAHAQSPPVVANLEGIFGNPAFLPNGYGTVLVTLQNRTTHTLRGTAYVAETGGSTGKLRHEAPVDLPPRSTRVVPLSVFASANGSSYQGGFAIDGADVAVSSVSTDYASGARSLVLLLDPLRLRGNVLDLEIDEVDDRTGAGTRTVRVPIGIARVDPASGDPLLPEEAAAWSTVSLLVASAPLLARASPAARAAIEGWLRAGGRLLVVPRTDADLHDPALHALIGDVERGTAADALHGVGGGFVPRTVRAGLTCGAGLRTEAFGCGRRFGFGQVWTSEYDLNAAANATTHESRELVRALLGRVRSQGIDAPLLRYGADEEQQTDSGMGGWTNGTTFGLLRAALDPNEGYTPALGIAGLLLLIYVVLIGPVNFTMIGRRNKPTLALITTPALSFGCLVLLLAVGYIGKGVTMRYRRVELVELIEGDRVAPSRRYTGLFLTHPATFDVTPPADGMVTIVPGTGTDVPPTIDHSVEPPRLHAMRGRLWETVFTREDRERELGGTIRFVRDDRRLAFVENHTGYTLRGAVVLDTVGGVYRVGDVAPGARTAIPVMTSGTTASPSSYFSASESDPQWKLLTNALSLHDEDVKTVIGLAGMLNGSLVTTHTPTLIARLDAGHRPADVAGFGVERDRVFVRVVPLPADELVTPAPPPTSPTGTPPSTEEDDTTSDDASTGDAPDAGPLVDPALGQDPFPPPTPAPPPGIGAES